MYKLGHDSHKKAVQIHFKLNNEAAEAFGKEHDKYQEVLKTLEA